MAVAGREWQQKGGTVNTPHVVNKPKDWATARAKGNGNGSATRIKRQLTEIVHATFGALRRVLVVVVAVVTVVVFVGGFPFGLALAKPR